MSTDIALRHTTDLESWVAAASQTHAIAVSLAKTSFVPKSMQGRPDEVTGAILAGRELGLEPMAALRSIDVIDGTPALRAVTLRGLVQSQGHEIWVEESTETRAIVCGRRRGEDQVQRSVWTVDRARRANLAGKKNWQTHPSAMLVARATSEICRLIAADVLIGMPYTTEELQDGFDGGTQTQPAEGVIRNIDTGDTYPVPAAPARRKRTAQRAPLPVPDLPEPSDHIDGEEAQNALPAGPSTDDDWPQVTDGAA